MTNNKERLINTFKIKAFIALVLLLGLGVLTTRLTVKTFATEDSFEPIFTGETAVISNVDDPLSLENVLAGIKAIDDVDGDITHKIQVVSDNYSANKNELGVYDIKLSVSDQADNTSNLTVKVSVVDVTPPIMTIDGVEIDYLYFENIVNTTGNPINLLNLSFADFQSSQHAPLTTPYDWIRFINANVYADSDQEKDLYFVDNGEHVEWQDVEADNLGEFIITLNELKDVSRYVVKDYKIKFKVVDNSGNASKEYTAVFQVRDTEAPVISGPNRYDTTNSNQLTIAAIKAGLQAHDNYDGDITSNITVRSDNYSSNYQQLGEYLIIFEVKDEAGNVATHEVIVNVTDGVPPVFHVNDAFITVAESLNWTQEQIISHLIRIGQLPADTLENYSITASNYIENAPIGDYQIVLTRNEGAYEQLKEVITVGIKVNADEDPIPGDNQPPTDVDKDDSDSFGVKIENFFKDYGAYVVIGFIGLIVVLVVVKAINPSGRRRW